MVFRLEPVGPVNAYQTYSVTSPLATHWRDASCSEVDCPNQAHGWRTVLDVSTDLGARQANYIRLKSGRAFTVLEDGTLVTFTFPPGQTCFTPHRLPVGRPEFFRIRGGDWRGMTSPARQLRPEDWLDHFAAHQQHLADRIQKG